MKTNTNRSGQGMNWIRPAKRLAIYMRDGLACVWCGVGVENGAKLTLDHVICQKRGGHNGEKNLITACLSCNSSRGSRTISKFAAAVAAYRNHGVTQESLLLKIKLQVREPLDVQSAMEMIRSRGGFTAAVQGVK